MHWIFLPLKRYAEFSGRSRRKEYWSFKIIFYGMLLVFGVTAFALGDLRQELGGANSAASAEPGPVASIFLVVLVLAVLAIAVPAVAVTVRRLHDRDMSGWWYLAFSAVSVVPGIGVFASVAWLVLMAMPGTDGPNRFGPDPKRDASEADVFA